MWSASLRELASEEARNTALIRELTKKSLSKKFDERTPPEATAGSWIDAFIGEAGDELLERDFPLAGRKTSPFYLNLDHLPASDRPAELSSSCKVRPTRLSRSSSDRTATTRLLTTTRTRTNYFRFSVVND